MGSWRHRALGAFDFLLVSVFLGLAVNYASDASLPGYLNSLQRRPWALLGCVLALIALRGWQRWNERASVWDRPADQPDAWKHLLPELSARVRRDWIDGVLAPSLELLGQPVAVRLAERADAVATPGERLLAPGNRPLPAGADILAAYDYAQRLLVLGTPGVGKTTALLSLADALLKRHASADRTPVVLHASTWEGDGARFDVWVVKQLGIQYGVPARAAWSFVSHGLVIPLVDGIDELPQPHRGGFIAAVNAYQGTAALYPLAVCCRREEYEALPERLLLETAVEILPLTVDDLDRWVESRDADREVLRAMLAGDPELRELAASPLMLGALAAAAADSVALGALGREGKRGALLDAYVSRALTRTPRARLRNSIPPDRLRAGLVTLAGLMRSRELTVLNPEVLQAEWLPKRWQARCGAYGFDLLDLAAWTGLAWWHAPWNLTGGGPLPALVVLLFGGAVVVRRSPRGEAGHPRGIRVRSFVWALLFEGVLVYALLRVRRDHPDLPYFVRTVLPLALVQPGLDLVAGWLGSRMPGTVGLPRGAGLTGASAALAASYGVAGWLSSVAQLPRAMVLFLAFVPPGMQTTLWRSYVDFRNSLSIAAYNPAMVRSVCWTLFFLTLLAAFWNGRVVSLLRGKYFRALLVRQQVLPSDLGALLEGARAHLLMHRSSGGYLFSHQLILEKLAQEAPAAVPGPGPWRLDPILAKPLLRAGIVLATPLFARWFGWSGVVLILTVLAAVYVPYSRWGVGINVPIPRGEPIWHPAPLAWEMTYGTTKAAMFQKYGRLRGWQITLLGVVALCAVDSTNWPGVGWLRFFNVMAAVGSLTYQVVMTPQVKFVRAGGGPVADRFDRRLIRRREEEILKQRAAVQAVLDDPQARENIALELGEAIDALSDFIDHFRALNQRRQHRVDEIVRDAVHYGVGVSLSASRPAPVDDVLLPELPLERALTEDEADIARYCAYIGYSIASASPLGRRIFVWRLKRQTGILAALAAQAS